MIIQMSVFSWISTIMSIVCLLWLVGLGVFVLVRSIILKVKQKREQKNICTESSKKHKRFYGVDEDDEF